MKTFKNKYYTKRNYECTNRIACQSLEAPNDNWIECNESITSSLTYLGMESADGKDVKYFGYL